jgi:hypothetical protein
MFGPAYIIHPHKRSSCCKFCAELWASRGLPSDLGTSGIAPGSLSAGFGPDGLGTGGIVSVAWAPAVSLTTCTNSQDHMLYHMYSTHHGIRRIQLFFFRFSLHHRRFSSPRCGEEFETDSVRKSCGKASTNLTSPSESPQLTTPQHHDHNRWLPNYYEPSVKASVKASCNRHKVEAPRLRIRSFRCHQ